MAAEFEFSSKRIDGGVLVVELSGNIRTDPAMQELRVLVSGAVEATHLHLILDLEKVRFLDSAGLGFLMLLNGLVRDAGGAMAIAGANEAVQKIFDYTAIASLIPLLATVHEAKAHLRSQPATPRPAEG